MKKVRALLIVIGILLGSPVLGHVEGSSPGGQTAFLEEEAPINSPLDPAPCGGGGGDGGGGHPG